MKERQGITRTFLQEMNMSRVLTIALAIAGVGAGALPVTAQQTVTSQPPRSSVVATFQVMDESYRVELQRPRDIERARRILAGQEPQSIPNGLVRRGDAGVNSGWSWHIDPGHFEWADMTTEACDGIPSDVERPTWRVATFCPWSAKLISLEPAPAPVAARS
ncbi:hypothetical protein [Streptomyces sp. NPDC059918]|uniref:BP74-related protein n=1 Tax=unclassified Streptomyces TaxID=2593676 RepID=UPI0036601B0F